MIVYINCIIIQGLCYVIIFHMGNILYSYYNIKKNLVKQRELRN